MPRFLTVAGLTALAAAICAVAVSGCAGHTSGIDPSGRKILLPAYHDGPGPEALWSGMELLLYPQETVSPVGTEVVLLGGVRGRDQFLVTNQKIEWTISGGSVGHFVDLGWASPFDFLVCDFTFPRIIDGTRAIGSTSRKYIRLTRGNTNPNDDVEVSRGQTWVSVTSPHEGTTYVTAFSPDVYSWDLHKQTATIHWVDAQWQFPPPAINPAGTTHVLTTTVMKQTNQSPCVNWLVRYEIVGGPPAGFRPDGAQAIEVPTDGAGQASVEIFQQQAAAGTNQIAIQVIRPGGVGGGNGKRLVVGSGCTSKTWSAPGLSARISGPAVAAVGSTATYTIDVTNPGDLPTQDVVVTNPIPAGFQYLGSNPAGEADTGAVRWRLGDLSPGQSQSIVVDFRAETAGSVENCMEVTAAAGLSAKDCVTTNVSSAQLELRMVGPEQATVGEQVTFEIVITNLSEIPASGLLIKDRFGPGLEHAELESPIERDLAPPIAPGESRSIGVVFRVTRSGQHCHTVELLRDGQIVASERSCLTAVEPARPQPPPAVGPPQSPSTLPGLQPERPTEPLPGFEPERPTEPLPGLEPDRPTQPLPGLEPPPSTVLPQVLLKVSGPDSRTVGETAEFTIVVTNASQEALSNLRVVSDCDAQLEPSMASQGFQVEGDDLFWAVGTLAPSASQEFTLQARCLSPSPRACNRVRVVGEQAVLAEAEACLELRPAPTVTPADLSMDISDRLDPAPLGKPLTYVIEVANNGRTAARNVIVVVTLPPELTLVPLETTGPAVAPGYRREGENVRFNPAERLEPGGKLTYRVRVRASQPGDDIRFRAQLSSQDLQQPIVVEEGTYVFEE